MRGAAACAAHTTMPITASEASTWSCQRGGKTPLQPLAGPHREAPRGAVCVARSRGCRGSAETPLARTDLSFAPGVSVLATAQSPVRDAGVWVAKEPVPGAVGGHSHVHGCGCGWRQAASSLLGNTCPGAPSFKTRCATSHSIPLLPHICGHHPPAGWSRLHFITPCWGPRVAGQCQLGQPALPLVHAVRTGMHERAVHTPVLLQVHGST